MTWLPASSMSSTWTDSNQGAISTKAGSLRHSRGTAFDVHTYADHKSACVFRHQREHSLLAIGFTNRAVSRAHEGLRREAALGRSPEEGMRA
jgi:hypothetical protein